MQTTQTHRPPSSSKNSPAQLREAHRLPPSHPSYPVVSTSDATPHNVAITPRALPAGSLQSRVPEVRSKLLRAPHPTAPETSNSHLLICTPHTVKQRKRKTPTSLLTTFFIKTTATTPKMVPSFVTSRLARLSLEPSRPPWVLTAATRSSSITCRR